MSNHHLIPREFIEVKDSLENWESAVEIASLPLLKSEYISEEYVKNMINSVHDNGPYMVLADYFALMHARPGEGVHKQGMSLLVTREAVDLAGKEVKIFLVLAAEDSSSHLESLSKIMEIFMNQENFDAILNGDKNEIAQILS